MMMSDKSSFWMENHEEIYINLRYKESQRPILSHDYKSKPKCRLELIEMLESLCTTLDLSYNVLHLALNMIDYLMIPFYDMQSRPLAMILFTIVRLAAKVSDSDDHVPRLADFNKIHADLASAHDYNQLERRILQRFEWKITFPTVITFLNCFQPFFFLPIEHQANTKVLRKFGNHHILTQHLTKEITRIAMLAFQDLEAYEYLPSLMAAACIAIIRQAFQITPIWSFQLHRITKYSFGDMRQVIRFLRRFYPPESDYIEMKSNVSKLTVSQSSAKLSVCA